MPPVNDGVNIPSEIVSPDNVEILDILCAVIEYVFVVKPSLAVTIMVSTLSPIFKPILLELFPEFTNTPLTVIEAPASTAVGLTVTKDTLLAIELVYDNVVLENEGDSDPLLITNPESPASLLGTDDPTVE